MKRRLLLAATAALLVGCAGPQPADYAAERGFDTSRVTGDKKKEKDK